MLRSSGSMHESSGSHVFGKTTGIQSGSDPFVVPSLVMPLLTKLVVLKRKAGKEIPESSRQEFLEKFSANNFALSDAEDNTPRPLNRVGIADLPLFGTLLAIQQKSSEPIFWEIINSFDLLA